MGKLLVSVVVLVACASGLPATAGAQSVAQDSVVGSAYDCADGASCEPDPSTTAFTDITADAHSGPAGESPTGTMQWRERFLGDFRVSEAQVTCLSVVGKTAVIGVTGTTLFSRLGFSLQVAGLIRVTDGGGPASGQDTFEFDINAQQAGPALPGPTDCSAFPTGRPVHRNDGGDLIVTDVAPLPTSKDQCKNGGWGNYGASFKNQGQCVTFVERRPKP